jgi:hypothetical protein
LLSLDRRRLVSHSPVRIHDAVRSHSCLIERSACGGVKQPHATANQNCAPRSLVPVHAKSQHSRHRKICTLHNKSQKKFTSSWIQSMKNKEISVSGSKHQLL